MKYNPENNGTYLGIELGSTRIKAVLTDDSCAPIASGSYEWENRLENGFWTYSLDDIHKGITECYRALKRDVSDKYGVTLKSVGAIGVSAMMHGLMAFGENDGLLVPFRTWRNTTTERAAAELTELLRFNIPQRWSIAHLYQSVLDKEEYLSEVSYITTLSGYINYILTGEHAVGIGEASGIFPVSADGYDMRMAELVNDRFARHGFGRDIISLLPKVMKAGEKGLRLTARGADFLDCDHDLTPGIPVCPPEGDAGTGMTAANAVRPLTGNVSAGTSVFAMPVLEKPLSGVYPEIDIVATPDGKPAAMVHCNNCCAELDAWVKIFGEFAELMGISAERPELYEKLYKYAMTGEPDCGGITAYNYLSAEPVTHIADGKPMYFRTADSRMNLKNFMRSELYAAFAALRSGMDILFENESVRLGKLTAHGGLFKVGGVAQQILADALKIPVSVMKTAGEGGAWGMSLLAAYMVRGEGKNLADWLDSEVFNSMKTVTLYPDENGVKGFDKYLKRYADGLEAQKASSGRTE